MIDKACGKTVCILPHAECDRIASLGKLNQLKNIDLNFSHKRLSDHDSYPKVVGMDGSITMNESIGNIAGLCQICTTVPAEPDIAA